MGDAAAGATNDWDYCYEHKNNAGACFAFSHEPATGLCHMHTEVGASGTSAAAGWYFYQKGKGDGGCVLAAPAPLAMLPPRNVAVQITAVADKGSSGKCAAGGDQKDWIEVTNPGTNDVSVTGYTLADDKGAGHEDAYVFAAGAQIAAGATVLLCQEETFQFKIGGDDTIFLLDAAGALVDSSGQLAGQGAVDAVWTRSDDGTWGYASHASAP